MKYLILLLLLLFSSSTSAQNSLLTDSLENRLSALHGEERFKPLYQLAKLYSRTDPDKSLKYAKESYFLADSLQNDSLIISSLNALAIIHFYLGENFEGLKFLNMMITILEQKISDHPESIYYKRIISNAYNNAGTILSDIGEIEEAIGKFFSAEKFASELLNDLPDDVDLFDLKIMLYNNIGLLFYQTGNQDKGLEFLEIALEMSEQNELIESIALSLNNIGLINVSQNRLTEAFENYKRALKINHLTGDSITIGGNLHNLGWVYEKRMMYDSALFHYNNSLDISKRLKYQYGISNTLRSIGFIQTEMGNLGPAERVLEEALSIAVNSGIMELQEKAYKNLYELFQKKGDYKLANEYQDKYHQTTDSLYNLKSSNQLAYWQTRYETEKMEMENLALHKNNEIQQLKITRKNSHMLLLIIASVALLVFVVIILVMYRQKDRAYRNIVRKNMEIVAVEKQLYKSSLKTTEGPEPRGAASIDENDIENETLIESLEEYLTDEKPYLSPNITLNEICKHINTNRSYLSKFINHHFHLNFNTWINSYRVKEARRLLSEQHYDHISIEGIGELAGFNSKATFHASFKKSIGVTPYYYRQKRS
ncbi:MAG: tetratricopeptide repeat protein [Bacteroidales bacterium]|nr:tetratricopeptide repeat protein [Bacteroidales bacterium]